MVEDMEKDVEILCEDMVSSDARIFLGCSINIRVYTVFNKHTKSMMGFIKVFVNTFQIEMEDDLSEILHDIMVPAFKKNKKVLGGKKIPTNVLISPLENVSFHYEESVLKWKYSYHKRITLERKMSNEAFIFEEVVELLKDVIVK